jgi:parallel beta-helix repeat protein
MKRLILFFALLVVFAVCLGSTQSDRAVIARKGIGMTYYVDATSGDDGNTGTNTSAPWKTIAKVNAATLHPSDNVLFKKGEIWREQLTVPNSGASARPITFGAYGSGDNPIISGADLVGTWTHTDIVNAYSGTEAISDNFDDNDITDWTSSGDAAASSGQLHLHRVSGTTAYAYKASSALTEYWSSIQVNIASAAINWSTTNLMQGFVGMGTTTTAKLAMDLYNSGGTALCYYRYTNDAGVQTGSTAVVFTFDTWHTVVLHFKAATGAGNNDGVEQIWIDDTEVLNLSNVDSDTITMSSIKHAISVVTECTGDYDNAKLGTSGSGPVAGDPTNVWHATCTTEPKQVFFDGTKGTKVASAAACVAEFNWFWAANVLYVYSESDPDALYVVPGIEASQRGKCIYATGKDYITIDGIDTMKAGAIDSAPHNVNFYNCQHAILKNFTTTDGYHSGVCVFGGSSNCLVYNVEATLNGEMEGVGIGVWNPGTDNNEVSYCNVHDNYGTGITNHGLEGSVDGPDGTWIHHNSSVDNGRKGISITMATNTIVEHNTVTGNGSLDPDNSDGIKSSVGDLGTFYNTGNIIRYNLVGNNANYGIWTVYEINSSINYNIIYGNSSGIVLSAWDGGTVYNNTIYNNDNYNIQVATYSGSGASVSIRNNIMDTSSTKDYGIYVLDAAVGHYTSDYNVVNETYFGRLQTGGAYSLADWRTNTSQDSNSQLADPLFTSAGTGDFTLAVGSPAIDAGTDVSLTTDYAGNPVPYNTIPDIGAYEKQESGAYAPENFDSYANGDPLDAAHTSSIWTVVAGTWNIYKPASDGFAYANSASALSCIRYSGTSFSANQYAEVTFDTQAGNSSGFQGPAVRAQSGEATWYTLYWSKNQSVVNLSWIVAGVGADDVKTWNSKTYTTGQKLKLEVTGTGANIKLSCYEDVGAGWVALTDGVNLDPSEEGTYPERRIEGGSPGVGGYNDPGYGTFSITEWAGGDL